MHPSASERGNRTTGARLIPFRTLLAIAAGAAFVHPAVAAGESYPAKMVRVVTSAPGGGSDMVSRLVAQGMTAGMGQPVIVENRGGGVAGAYVAKSPPDGYTLLYYGSALWLMPMLRKDAAYDVVRDFAPVSWITRQPNVLVVHPSLPVKSVRALIALAKARPRELNYSSGGLGSSGQMAAELFKYMAGVNIVRINYKGQGPATNDVISGQVQLTFGTIGSVAPHVESGRLRALAVTSAQPSPHYPGLPTIASAGVPGYESEQRSGMFAPGGTPAPIISRLHQEVMRTLNTREVRNRIFSSGVEVVGSTPEQFSAMIKEEIARMSGVIQSMGIGGK